MEREGESSDQEEDWGCGESFRFGWNRWKME